MEESRKMNECRIITIDRIKKQGNSNFILIPKRDMRRVDYNKKYKIIIVMELIEDV